MKFHMATAGVYVPDGSPEDVALAKTTHMGISAHQDDIEIMAYHGIVECFGKTDKNFMGVVTTNGSGSPREDLYASYTDEEMVKVRRLEQKKAAFVGEYCAQAFLDYPSSAVKDGKNPDVIDDLAKLMAAAKPEFVYTHNLADKHDTHTSTCLRVIQAIRKLPKEDRPKTLYGCEVWRALDWLNDDDKIIFNVEGHENIAAAVLGVHDSQICGGKRYDLAAIGRRKGNATFFASHGVDDAASISFGIDMTALVKDDNLDPKQYIQSYIDRFSAEVSERLTKLLG